ncbi:hypothetical protein BC941DRAFT_439184 [Chlamydoabsidia padenii]|nr:hypothetical protein BC941DRAFT_439184 [Chlamydoabsidia padenii]
MSDLFWCTHCDNVISHYSESLYCSEQCLRADALRNHPLLGYTYPEFVDFPRPYAKQPTVIDSSVMPKRTRSISSTCSTRDSIHTPPTLSTTHSSCQTSPSLSAFETSHTLSLLSLPPTLSTINNNKKSSCIPSLLLMGTSTPTTALSRPYMSNYRPIY